MNFIIISIVFFLIFLFLTIKGLRQLKETAGTLELIIATIYILSLCLFILGMLTHSNQYDKAIDPVDHQCYSPFALKHSITLIFYFLAFHFSLLLVWGKNKNLPPLTKVLALVFIIFGIIFNIVILFQISEHDTSKLTYDKHEIEQIFFAIAPLLSTLIGLWLIVKTLQQEIGKADEKTYQNKYLNYLNAFLATRSRNPIWIVILLFPVFLIVTLALILFGQEANSVIKVFTDTATWKLSQQTHPPILDHRGHYL